MIPFDQSKWFPSGHLQVDPETLASLATRYATKGKGKFGGGADKGGMKLAPPPSSSHELTKSVNVDSEGDTCITPVDASSVPKATEHECVYISSDESDSDSSFPESNDSDAESGEMVQTRVKTEEEDARSMATSHRSNTVATLQPASQASELMSTPKSTGNSTIDGSKGTEALPQGWTGAEVTYFRLLHPIFGHNYCTIAELVRSKTCQEVFQYSQVAGSELLQGECTRRFNAKKKKKNMR